MSTENAGHAADLMTEANRMKLALLVTRLFDRWGVDAQTQLQLLGLKMGMGGLAMLETIRNGGCLPADTDMIERVGHLLAIHRSLQILYTANLEVVYGWMTHANKRFQPTPVGYVLQQDDCGTALAAVRHYLDFARLR